MAKRSQKWLKEHFSDPYVKKSQEDGYRSRAAYKLLELNQKHRLLKPGMRVVDLGAAPGGWAQVAAELIGSKGELWALDRLPMDPLPGVTFIEGDFTEEAILEQLLACIPSGGVDLVISDMAPNLSGNKHIDQPRAMHLIELAFDLAERILKQRGDFLFKIFHGEGLEQFVQMLKTRFKVVKWCKPDASRARSSEVYILARGFIRYTDTLAL
jgi:23S rRNA (uridine2552-2'-O)-methyltransferase